jgi:spore germination protein KA
LYSFIKRKIQYLNVPGKTADNAENVQEIMLTKNIQRNLASFSGEMGVDNDVVIRNFTFGRNNSVQAAVLYLDGLTDKQQVDKNIISQLLKNNTFDRDCDIKDIENYLASSGDMYLADSVDSMIGSCLSGNAALLFDGFDTALIIGCKYWEKRSVSEPQTEPVIRGPREGFTEDFITNLSLVRRKIKSSSLKAEFMTIGKRTKTKVCVLYIKDIADAKIVETIKGRLKRINTDAILETGYIEQYIEDFPLSIFHTTGYTEKPDVAAGKLLEGRIAIVVDGTPFVLTAPRLFAENFQTAEDYYVGSIYGSLIRILRFISYFIAIFAPAIYVALSTFHQELIPTSLLITMAKAREGVPLSAFFEALAMLTAFEILREAGLRLPRAVGQAISIVGALIMGDAAVAAGFVGSTIVIIIALAAVASFVVTLQIESVSILRLIMLFLAGLFGGYGIALGFLGLLIHLSNLKSYTVPFLGSIAPAEAKAMKDVFVRAPMTAMNTRELPAASGDADRGKGKRG